MATRFEIVLHGEDPIALRAAAEAVFEEVERVENQLSLYRPATQIAHLNARAAREPVRVTPEVFALLEQAKRLHAETEGAFDVTVGPLVRCWGFMGGQGKTPTSEALQAARACVGMQLVELDPRHRTVRFARQGVMLDLGAIGKGYAIEQGARALRELGVTCALLHAGTSTVYALGAPPGREAWTVAIETPPPAVPAAGLPALPQVRLRDEALSVSAVWGRAFRSGDELFGHVLDPRTGQPVHDVLLAAVVAPSATETDALSTALLVQGRDGWTRFTKLRPRLRALILARRGKAVELFTHGFENSAPAGWSGIA